MNDAVNHPSHYTTGNIECIEAIEEATKSLDGTEAYFVGNIIKYVWRWKHKNGVEDLEKAKWYLNRLIRSLKKGEYAVFEHLKEHFGTHGKILHMDELISTFPGLGQSELEKGKAKFHEWLDGVRS